MRKMKILLGKELLDILRDKKTLIIMVLVPILLYPAMLMGIVLVSSGLLASQKEKTYQVAYSAEDVPVQELKEFYEENKEEGDTLLEFLPIEEGKEKNRESYDVWLTMEEQELGAKITVEYTSTNQDSDYAMAALKKLAEDYGDKLMAQNLAEEGLPEAFLTPVILETKDSVTASESMGMNLGGILGMLLMTNILLGAFYPVIDSVTGEKERGTLETLLTLPVNSFQMIMSKFIAVSIFACGTAILSLVSMTGSVLFMFGNMGADMGKLGIKGEMILGWIPVLLAAVLVAAVLVTALCMSVCVFAKSFKEANNYITPIILVIMLASMAAMIPSFQLDYKTVLIPIVNVTLLVKQVLGQQLDPALAGITIGINLGVSILVVWILSKMYNSENILFKDGFQSFRLFERRSEIKKGTVPRTGDLILCLAVTLLLSFYLGAAASMKHPLGSTVVMQLLILSIPFILVWYIKSDTKALFSFYPPGAKQVVGGLLLYLGTYAAIMLAGGLLAELLPDSTQNVETAFALLMEYPVWLLVILITIMPAIGEEFFFRGLLFGSWERQFGGAWAVFLSSLIFGAFHLSLVKLLPTAMLGACFAYITWRSGSIYIGMGLHLVNNLFSLMAMKYPHRMGELLPILMKTEVTGMDVLILIIAAIAGVTAGVTLLNRGKEKAGGKKVL